MRVRLTKTWNVPFRPIEKGTDVDLPEWYCDWLIKSGYAVSLEPDITDVPEFNPAETTSNIVSSEITFTPVTKEPDGSPRRRRRNEPQPE